MRWSAFAGGEATAHGIDLAPMLDFVVNLLIFFIITAVFTKELGIAVNRPTGREPDGQKKSATISIGANGEIVFAGQPVDPRAVRANIERVKAENVDVGVLVVAHESAPTGLLITVVDQVRLGGVFDVTFATTKSADGLATTPSGDSR
jgi:biopolymer transport protein ExbD